MKKKSLIFVFFIFLFLFIGCDIENNSNNKENFDMYIDISELTEEEENILDLVALEKDFEIYEYKVDDDVKYKEINLYEFKDNNWEEIGSISGEHNSTTGRILIYFNDDVTSFIISEEDENGNTIYEMNLDKLDKNLSRSGTRINEPTEIVYGEEIGIKILILSSQNEIKIMGIDYIFDEENKFELDKHEKVYGVTIMFDNKAHEE